MADPCQEGNEILLSNEEWLQAWWKCMARQQKSVKSLQNDLQDEIHQAV